MARQLFKSVSISYVDVLVLLMVEIKVGKHLKIRLVLYKLLVLFIFLCNSMY
jgi:hypothetical protein